MGAWDVKAFGNDDANDWAYGLEEVEDLSYVESAFDEVEAASDGYLEAPSACNALAACEVLARLRGNPGYKDSYTEKVDEWVSAHKITPSTKLIARGAAAIDRILKPKSELVELWDDTPEAQNWRESVSDLRNRLTADGRT